MKLIYATMCTIEGRLRMFWRKFAIAYIIALCMHTIVGYVLKKLIFGLLIANGGSKITENEACVAIEGEMRRNKNSNDELERRV